MSLSTSGGPHEEPLAHRQLQRYAHDLMVAYRTARTRAAELEAAYFETVLRLLEASLARDHETGEHLTRIQRYVELLGGWLGWDAQRRHQTALASALHDVGKIALPDSILRKPDVLDAAEWELMKSHTTIGARILTNSPSPVLQLGESIALTHHERWCGGGYPLGLRGEAIPIEARMVMLADQYDALRSSRPYKPARDHATAVATILEGDGRTEPNHFDPLLLASFRERHLEFAEVYEQAKVPDETDRQTLLFDAT